MIGSKALSINFVALNFWAGRYIFKRRLVTLINILENGALILIMVLQLLRQVDFIPV